MRRLNCSFLLISTALLAVMGSLSSATTAVAAEAAEATSCIPMSNLQTLVFTQSMTDTRRRGSNVPKLQCVGNCPAEAPPLLQAHCTSQGLDDYGKPTWRCVPQFAEAGDAMSLNGRRKFGIGQIRVECEGCLKAGDSDIVRGSCVLKYSITTNGAASRSHGNMRANRRHHHRGDFDDSHHISSFLWIVLILTSICIIIAVFNACMRSGSQNGGGSSGYPSDVNGNVYGAPIYNNGTTNGGCAPSQQHHHHYGGGGYGYGGGGGFGTGMLTGYIIGDAMSRAHGGGAYGGGGYEGGSGGQDWGGGGDSGFDAGGWGGMDAV